MIVLSRIQLHLIFFAKILKKDHALLLPASLKFNSEAGRVASSGFGFGGTTLFSAAYGYDDVGNIASLTNTTPAADAAFQYDAFNRLTKATYPEKIYDYAYDPFGNMLAAKENGLTVFNKSYSAANRISDFSYDSRGNQTGGNGFTQVWDKRNRLVESRTSANVLLGSYVYNECGLRIKAERISQPMVQVVEPNGGESLYLGAMNTVSWSGLGLAGGTVKLELLVDGAVDGTIAEGIPGELTSYQWQAGKMLGGWANAGTNYKVRVTAVAPPVASGTTYYFYDSGGRLLAEYDGTGVCVKDYLYLGGKMIGEFVPSTGSYYYYAADQINSTRLVTDSIGAVVHSAQYDPYGGLYKTWLDAYHPKPGFSGKEREFGSEMDYFGARYYGHSQYKFLTTDPVINKNEALTNPQLWNFYSYCENNPITYVDPDGLLKRNANGELKFLTGPDRYATAKHPGDTSKVVRVQWGYLITDSGKRIFASKNLSDDARFDADCHGYTFADGKYWISNDQVKSILEGDNYKEITDPQEGDIVVWFDKKSNEVKHSMTIQSISEEGTYVKGKAGIIGDEAVENVPLKSAWKSDDIAKYYRK